LVFLQECSFSTARKFLSPVFGGTYHVRITLKATQVSEGCALLIRKSAFTILEEKDVLFRSILLSHPAFRRHLQEIKAKWPDFLQGILPHMPAIFQLGVVRHVLTGEVIVLANTHFFFHPLARHIRLLQAMCLLQQVHELREKYTAGGRVPRVLLCGDLNCTPDTAALALLVEGEVASDHPDWLHSKQFTWRDEEQDLSDMDDDEDPTSARALAGDADSGNDVEPLPEDQWQPGIGLALRSPLGKLASAYADSPPEFTNYVHNFNATLDYILTGGQWRVLRTLPGVSEEDLRPHGGLPSVLHPSDHLSIAVDFSIEAMPP